MRRARWMTLHNWPFENEIRGAASLAEIHREGHEVVGPLIIV